MGKTSSKRRPPEEEDDEPAQGNWLTSYSDMISLLFCLFVVLYGMSKVNEESFRQLSEALSKSLSTGGLATKTPHKMMATDNVQEGGKFDKHVQVDAPPDDDTIRMKRLEQLQELKKDLEGKLEKQGLRNSVSIDIQERGMVISLMTDKLLFELGKADLKDRCTHILQVISPTLLSYEHPIRIEGNTCDLPIHTSEFDSNWDLSTKRATSVAKYLIFKHKIKPERVSIIGYGEYKPRFPNTTEGNRQKNRRVDIVILDYNPNDPFGKSGSDDSSSESPPPGTKGGLKRLDSTFVEPAPEAKTTEVKSPEAINKAEPGKTNPAAAVGPAGTDAKGKAAGAEKPSEKSIPKPEVPGKKLDVTVKKHTSPAKTAKPVKQK